MLRVSLRHIDDFVSDTITLTDAVRSVRETINQSPRSRDLPTDRIASKVRARLRSDWNIEVSRAVVTNEIENIVAVKS